MSDFVYLPPEPGELWSSAGVCVRGVVAVCGVRSPYVDNITRTQRPTTHLSLPLCLEVVDMEFEDLIFQNSVMYEGRGKLIFRRCHFNAPKNAFSPVSNWTMANVSYL